MNDAMEDNEKLKTKTARGLLWGGIGSGGLQLLNLFFGIFLSRLLSPADYGVVGALTIFSATAGLLAESGFTLAIVNKKEVTDSDYNAVFWFNIVAGVACYLILYLLAPAIARFYGQPEMVPLSRFLFLGFLFGSSAGSDGMDVPQPYGEAAQCHNADVGYGVGHRWCGMCFGRMGLLGYCHPNGALYRHHLVADVDMLAVATIVPV